MGEYARLNNMLRQKKEELKNLREELQHAEGIHFEDITEEIINCENKIGEIKAALYEMADMDGLEDYGEAFDY